MKYFKNDKYLKIDNKPVFIINDIEFINSFKNLEILILPESTNDDHLNNLSEFKNMRTLKIYNSNIYLMWISVYI